jgi:hypothetical protein
MLSGWSQYVRASNDDPESWRHGALMIRSNRKMQRILSFPQLGNEKQGLKELTTVARRAPGSIDMRAALAALYWSQVRGAKLIDRAVAPT